MIENGGGSYHLEIYLYEVNNGKVENNTCRNNDTGIWLDFSSEYNILDNNTCSNNWDRGICMQQHSSYNNLANNICENNGCGISLLSSYYDNLTNNTCENNRYGIFLSGSFWYTPGGAYPYSSSSNNLINNTCENNSWGVYLSSSNGDNSNTIFHNRLLNNTENNAYDNGTNYWGKDGVGNCWSDWQPPEHPDTNNDGIVDQLDDVGVVWGSRTAPVDAVGRGEGVVANDGDRAVRGLGRCRPAKTQRQRLGQKEREQKQERGFHQVCPLQFMLYLQAIIRPHLHVLLTRAKLLRGQS